MGKIIKIIVLGVVFVFLGLFLIGLFAPDDETTTTSKDAGTHAEYEDAIIDINDCEFTKDSEGNKVIAVHFTFTNNGEELYPMISCFAIDAIQDDEELSTINVGGKKYESLEDNSYKDIRNGKTLDCVLSFELASDSPVEVRIGTPTADKKLLAIKTFSK